MKKRSVTWLLIALGTTVAALGTAKVALERAADDKSQTIIERIGKFTAEENFLKKTTGFVHNSLTNSATTGEMPVLMRLRPYLTHRFVPSPLRLRNGTVDVIFLDQTCDNAARAMTFILHRAGFAASQFNVVGPSQSHTIVRARLSDGRDVMLDPHFGVIPEWEGELLGARQTQKLLREGKKPDDIWQRLDANSKIHPVHRQFQNVRFAAQGNRLELISDIRLPPGGVLQLGTRNGSGEDVGDAGTRAELTGYWHYMGSRYDREWIRGLRFHQPTRVVFGLTEDAIDQLITSNRPASIEGRTLVYELSGGETLLFVDGDAGFDWVRMRSYQDVDFLRFEALKQVSK